MIAPHADGDHEVAQGIDDGGRAGIDQDSGVELGDDGWPGHGGADRQRIADVERRVEPDAVEIDLAAAGPCRREAAAGFGREGRQVDDCPLADHGGA
jgi:hypothetical protein